MPSEKYYAEQDRCAKIANLAIESVERYPPGDFEYVIKYYKNEKESILNPEPQFQNLKSLKMRLANMLVYFQETANEAVSFFWEQAEKQVLGIERKTMLEKILKKNKISNEVEYDYVTDIIVVAEQEGLISNEQSKQLKQMLGDFENR